MRRFGRVRGPHAVVRLRRAGGPERRFTTPTPRLPCAHAAFLARRQPAPALHLHREFPLLAASVVGSGRWAAFAIGALGYGASVVSGARLGRVSALREPGPREVGA